MERRILEALRSELPDIQGRVRFERTTDRFNGHLLSARFRGQSFVERQKRVFTILRSALGDDAQRISMLFTYTPDEYAALLEAA